MGLSIDEYRQMKAQNRITWDANTLNSMQRDVSRFLTDVDKQARYEGEQWGSDVFNKQKDNVEGLRNRLNALKAYAESVKDSDEKAYRQAMDAHRLLNAGLDSAGKWFADNSDEEKRTGQYKVAAAIREKFKSDQNWQGAIREMRIGAAPVGEIAQKYGLDAQELQQNYREMSEYDRQEVRRQRYEGLGFNELVGVLGSADSLGQRVYEDIRKDYGNGLQHATEFDRNYVFESRAQKFGLSTEEVKHIVETYEQNPEDKHYVSAALSDPDKAYVVQRILETGTSEELKQLQKSLPSASYYAGLRSALKDAIEEKLEEEYYLQYIGKIPDLNKTLEQLDEADKSLSDFSRSGYVPPTTLYRDTKTDAVNRLKEAGVEDPDKLLKHYRRYMEKARNKKWQDDVREFTSQNAGTAVLGSIISVPINMIGSVGDVLKIAGARLEELGGGDGWYDTNGTANKTAQTIRGTVNEMIGDENHIGQLLYSTAMSGGDMVLAAAVNAIPVVGQAASNAMFFSSAGVAAANEVIENGGNLSQATAAMIAQGSAELLFERMSLDKLEALATSGNVTDAREYFKNIVKQAFVEGSEEFNTTLCNTLTDALIMGDNNQIARETRKYMEQGMSRAEANEKAWQNWTRGIIDDAIGGALSGGVLGGAAGAQNAVAVNKRVELGGFAVTVGEYEALTGGDDRRARKIAAELMKEHDAAKVIDAAKKSGNAELLELAQKAERQMQKAERQSSKGKIDGETAAALWKGLAREQTVTDVVDGLARAAGTETLSDYREKRDNAAAYNSEFDETGQAMDEAARLRAENKQTRAFGTAHTNGVYAKDIHGKQVVVTGIESSAREYGGAGNHVVLRTSDGKKVNAGEVMFDNPDFQRLVNYAPTFDTLGARAFVADYEDARAAGITTEQYMERFEALYKMGRAGVTFENAQKNAEYSGIIRSVGESTARDALRAGNNDTEMHVQLADMRLRRVRVPNQRTSAGSRLYAESNTEIKGSEDFVQVMQAVAQLVTKNGRAGRDIVFTDRLRSDERGVYADGKIYINAEADEHTAVAVALHEAVHKGKVYAPLEYRALESFVFNYLAANNQNAQALLDDIAARWGQDAADSEAQREELVAQTIMALASDENALRKAIETKANKKLLDRVKEAIAHIVERLKAFFRTVDEQGRTKGHNLQAQPWLDDVQALEQLAERFSEMMAEVRESEARVGSLESREKFAKKKDFKDYTNSEKNKSALTDDSEIEGKKSKDDTIFDLDDEEQLWWDEEYERRLDEQVKDESDEIDPEDEWGRTFREIARDDLIAKDSRTVDVDKLLENETPDMAVFQLYSNMSRMAEGTLRGASSIRLEDADYEKVAQRVMRNYGIKGKNFSQAKSEIAARIKSFVEDVAGGKRGDFSVYLNALATDARQFLEYSGNYERENEELARAVSDVLRGRTLIITPFEESEVLDRYDGRVQPLRNALKGYLHVGFEQDIGKYKNPVYMDDLIDEISQATANPESMGEISPLFPDGERPHSLEGFAWLTDVINNVLRPKFRNPYISGEFGENIDTAAMDMAFDIVTETMKAKSEKANAQKSVDRKTINELKRNSQKAQAEREAVFKAKRAKYQKQFLKMRERLRRSENLRASAEEDYAVLKSYVTSDLHNYRQQYRQRVETQKNIEAVRRDIGRLRTMIMNPTNEKFIPPEILHNKVFLNAAEALGEAVVLNKRSQAAEKMQAMVREIKSLKEESERYDGDFEEAFDDEYANELQGLADWLVMDYQTADENGVRKITRESLDDYEIARLRQTVGEILHRIENARKLLGQRDNELAREASDRAIRETRAISSNRAKKIFAGFAQEMMNPIRAVNLMSNYNQDAELNRLFDDINNGQRKEWFWEMEAEKPFAALVKENSKEYKKACNDVVHYDYTVNGKGYHLDMTRMQALQVLMTWKRESRSKMLHMKRGGIVVADPKVVAKGKGLAWENAQRVPVGSDLIDQIVKPMTKFENAYLRLAERYFNEVAKKAINETFLVTRHREIAKSEYYIPVKVDDKFTKAEIQSLKFDFTLEGAGSYKRVTSYAPQPILIESLNSVIDRHIKQTGKLYGLDIPLTNFKRMFKGTTRFAPEGSEWFGADSVKKALSDKFGGKSVQYLEDTIAALEAGRTKDKSQFDNITEFLYRAKVQTSLVGNLGVVIKQAASYPTAGLYLTGTELTAGLGRFFGGKKADGKRFAHFYQKTIDEIDRHTAQHYIRRKGMSVQEVSDMLHGSLLAKNAPTVVNSVKWIQAMDCATTAALWEAAKSHVDRAYKKSGRETGSNDYWNEVTDLYDTIIENTQPMYDELHRSDFQKKSNGFIKFVFPFKTQPLQNMGILANAAAEFVTKRDKASARKFGKAVASQISSILVFSVMEFAAGLLRHRADRYKDENDELTFFSAMPHIMWDMFSNGINTVAPVGGDFVIPAVNDIADSIEKKAFKADNLKNATSISLVNDWFTRFTKAANLLNDQLNGTNKAGVNAWDLTWKVLDVPGNFSEIFGIPYNNLSLLFKGAGNYVRDNFNYGLTNNYGELKTDRIANHILNAYSSGNTKKAEDLQKLWIEQYMSQGKTYEQAQKAVQNKLVTAVAAKPEAQEAARAKAAGNLAEHKRLMGELTAKGIDSAIAQKAVDSIANKLKAEQGDSDSGSGSSSKSAYSYREAFEALAAGDGESYAVARDAIAQKLMDDGKAEDEEDAQEQVEKKMKSLTYTKDLFADYYSVSGNKFKEAREKLLRIYGSESELKKKYEEYVKRYR